MGYKERRNLGEVSGTYALSAKFEEVPFSYDQEYENITSPLYPADFFIFKFKKKPFKKKKKKQKLP